jgi:peptidoglycan/xylan/chitin deacetylase (PgdA/CDA1 family)
VIKAEDLINAVTEKSTTGTWSLPRNSLLLTFDDGYCDHYQNVFPLLSAAGLQGSFFPPAKAIGERKLLDVNKIHFILASVEDKRLIVRDIFTALDEYRADHHLESNEAFYDRLARASRHDKAEIIFIKRALQVALPKMLREKITDELFSKYVSADEKAFADELYLTTDQLREMAAAGMYVGSHGYNHAWMGSLTQEEQVTEVERSLQFLEDVGTDLRAWIMCYPHGDVNATLLDLLRARGCAVGLTTQLGIATSALDPLLFPRLDTNDIPKRADASSNAWLSRVA